MFLYFHNLRQYFLLFQLILHFSIEKEMLCDVCIFTCHDIFHKFQKKSGRPVENPFLAILQPLMSCYGRKTAASKPRSLIGLLSHVCVRCSMSNPTPMEEGEGKRRSWLNRLPAAQVPSLQRDRIRKRCILALSEKSKRPEYFTRKICF